MRWNRHGQVTAEVAVLFAFTIAGFVFMGVYLQRGIQGSTKSNADSVGSQFSTQNPWSSFSASDTHEEGAITTTTSCSDSLHVIGGTEADDLSDCGARSLDEASTVNPTLPDVTFE